MRAALVERLDEGGRGDRGWWLITRVHLSAARLQQIAAYLHDAGAAHPFAPTKAHYEELGSILGITTANPGQTIRRHYLLAMETPLGLLRKINPRRWDQIVLTPPGIQLATEGNVPAVFESILQDIRFCEEPWFTASRVTEYSEFSVAPYPAILAVLKRNGGYIDVDDFDLFVSRIRTPHEIDGASEHVAEYRTLTEHQKELLRAEVERRMPAGAGGDERKPYNNWRDTARHSFSLFSLGESALRVGNELFLSRALAQQQEPQRETERRDRGRERATRRLAPRTPITLLIPGTEAPEDLLTPPALPRGNTGAEAELLIGKILAAAGWQVVYYNQRRGYGFDLWASRGERAFVIEVKSFLGNAGAVALTALEHEAAHHHRENYLLVIVERADEEVPVIYVVQDPAGSLRFVERNAVEFSAPRIAWERAANRELPD